MPNAQQGAPAHRSLHRSLRRRNRLHGYPRNPAIKTATNMFQYTKVRNGEGQRPLLIMSLEILLFIQTNNPNTSGA